MDLLPPDIAKQLPKLYEQEKLGEDAIAHVKFFDPHSQWTWYATEFDGEDTFFGLVIGFETELGYFSLKELQACKNRLGLGIERDLYFTPTSLKEIRENCHGNL